MTNLLQWVVLCAAHRDCELNIEEPSPSSSVDGRVSGAYITSDHTISASGSIQHPSQIMSESANGDIQTPRTRVITIAVG